MPSTTMINETKVFRALEACEWAGITYRQLDYWSRLKVITPSVTDANGSGTQRRYSLDDMHILKMLGSLMAYGFSTTTMTFVVAQVRELLSKNPGAYSAYLVIDKHGNVKPYTQVRNVATALAKSEVQLVYRLETDAEVELAKSA